MPSGKLPPRYASIVMPLILSLAMTAIVSAISVLRTQGFGMNALSIWPSTWALSWLIAFPVLLVILPVVRRLTAMIVRVS